MIASSSRRVFDAVDAALGANPRLVVAVSGGVDSMVLLHALSARAAEQQIVVATFDHGTGDHARDAVDFVVREAERRELRVVRGRAGNLRRSEDAWRLARWRFLRGVAAAERAIVATAHTRDDQAETVVMRLLRETGARGLAALNARSDIVRPFLPFRRRDLVAFAEDQEVPWVDDPTNSSREFLRNRVRLDLIPALERIGVLEELLELSARAAEVRDELDRLAHEVVIKRDQSGRLHVSRAPLAGLERRALCALWPSIAALAGLRLDRRGTVRLAEFTSTGEPGSRVQIAGGSEIHRHGDTLVIETTRRRSGAATPSRLIGATRFGSWRFFPGSEGVRAGQDSWWAFLPSDSDLEVRSWRPGDRMVFGARGGRRRVKRFLADARVPALDRDGWPVVTANGEIVWIPGVSRSPAATVRSGRSVVLYRCERFDG
jgi:tRNA(Ile)-lysidine synthase